MRSSLWTPSPLSPGQICSDVLSVWIQAFFPFSVELCLCFGLFFVFAENTVLCHMPGLGVEYLTLELVLTAFVGSSSESLTKRSGMAGCQQDSCMMLHGALQHHCLPL